MGCFAGARCVEMTGVAKPPDGSFGNLVEMAPAEGYRGHAIRLKAAVRVQGPGTQALMWLRVDRADGLTLSLDNIGDRPITSSAWNHYETLVGAPEDALKIVFGVRLHGPGKAWVDNFSLETIGELTAQGPRSLTAQGLRNLTAFTKLYGYVRFFHPSDQATATDWQRFPVDGVRAIESAVDDAEIASRLTALFRPVAPTVELNPSSAQPPSASPPTDATREWIRIDYVGVKLPEGTTPNGRGVYRSTRIKAPAKTPPRPPFIAELVPGLFVSVPLTLPTGPDSTLPHLPKLPAPPLAPQPPTDRVIEPAGVVVAWNILQHLHPYFDVVEAAWPAELPKA